MNLTCVITDSPEPPSYIFWRHDDTVSKLKKISLKFIRLNVEARTFRQQVDNNYFYR